MVDNRKTEAAWHYHDGTKHPGGFLLDAWHQYDPRRQPLLYKRYLDLPKIQLPINETPAGMPALEAIATQNITGEQASIPDLGTLARLLYYSAGITRSIRYPGWGELQFRAAATTGALYHIELYVVCKDLPDLAAGVYHFDPFETTLRPLRQGDFRPVLVEASGNDMGLRTAPAVIIYTDVFWRNAVKYQAREYRHAFWDSGTIIANTLAMAAAHRLPARLVTGFVDQTVNQLLGLDSQREVALEMLTLGTDREEAAKEAPPVELLNLTVQPVSNGERVFPAIFQMHEASSLDNAREVEAWREQSQEEKRTPDEQAILLEENWIRLQPLAGQDMPQDPIEKVIRRRGSTRRFSRESISYQELSTILQRSTQDIPADFLKNGSLNQVYLIANAVDGLPVGSYVYHQRAGALEPLRAGDFREEAGALALGQDLAADASANFYILADLENVLERYGNRGYRAAQLEASIIAGKMYLAAYALRRGGTGLTFFDDAVTEFFSPHARGKSVMFLFTAGVKDKSK